MAVITPTVTVLNNATLKVGASNYETSISKVLLSPSVPNTKFKGIGGNTIAGAGTPEWTVQVDYLQDWATVNSFSKLLLESAGTTVACDFFPKVGGAGYRVSVVLQPGPMGGDVDAQLEASVTLVATGQPTII